MSLIAAVAIEEMNRRNSNRGAMITGHSRKGKSIPFSGPDFVQDTIDEANAFNNMKKGKSNEK